MKKHKHFRIKKHVPRPKSHWDKTAMLLILLIASIVAWGTYDYFVDTGETIVGQASLGFGSRGRFSDNTDEGSLTPSTDINYRKLNLRMVLRSKGRPDVVVVERGGQHITAYKGGDGNYYTSARDGRSHYVDYRPGDKVYYNRGASALPDQARTAFSESKKPNSAERKAALKSWRKNKKDIWKQIDAVKGATDAPGTPTYVTYLDPLAEQGRVGSSPIVEAAEQRLESVGQQATVVALAGVGGQASPSRVRFRAITGERPEELLEGKAREVEGAAYKLHMKADEAYKQGDLKTEGELKQQAARLYYIAARKYAEEGNTRYAEATLMAGEEMQRQVVEGISEGSPDIASPTAIKTAEILLEQAGKTQNLQEEMNLREEAKRELLYAEKALRAARKNDEADKIKKRIEAVEAGVIEDVESGLFPASALQGQRERARHYLSRAQKELALTEQRYNECKSEHSWGAFFGLACGKEEDDYDKAKENPLLEIREEELSRLDELIEEAEDSYDTELGAQRLAARAEETRRAAEAEAAAKATVPPELVASPLEDEAERAKAKRDGFSVLSQGGTLEAQASERPDKRKQLLKQSVQQYKDAIKKLQQGGADDKSIAQAIEHLRRVESALAQAPDKPTTEGKDGMGAYNVATRLKEMAAGAPQAERQEATQDAANAFADTINKLQDELDALQAAGEDLPEDKVHALGAARQQLNTLQETTGVEPVIELAARKEYATATQPSRPEAPPQIADDLKIVQGQDGKAYAFHGGGYYEVKGDGSLGDKVGGGKDVVVGKDKDEVPLGNYGQFIEQRKQRAAAKGVITLLDDAAQAAKAGKSDEEVKALLDAAKAKATTPDQQQLVADAYDLPSLEKFKPRVVETSRSESDRQVDLNIAAQTSKSLEKQDALDECMGHWYTFCGDEREELAQTNEALAIGLDSKAKRLYGYAEQSDDPEERKQLLAQARQAFLEAQVYFEKAADADEDYERARAKSEKADENAKATALIIELDDDARKIVSRSGLSTNSKKVDITDKESVAQAKVAACGEDASEENCELVAFKGKDRVNYFYQPKMTGEELAVERGEAEAAAQREAMQELEDQQRALEAHAAGRTPDLTAREEELLAGLEQLEAEAKADPAKKLGVREQKALEKLRTQKQALEVQKRKDEITELIGRANSAAAMGKPQEALAKLAEARGKAKTPEEAKLLDTLIANKADLAFTLRQEERLAKSTKANELLRQAAKKRDEALALDDPLAKKAKYEEALALAKSAGQQDPSAQGDWIRDREREFEAGYKKLTEEPEVAHAIAEKEVQDAKEAKRKAEEARADCTSFLWLIGCGEENKAIENAEAALTVAQTKQTKTKEVLDDHTAAGDAQAAFNRARREEAKDVDVETEDGARIKEIAYEQFQEARAAIMKVQRELTPEEKKLLGDIEAGIERMKVQQKPAEGPPAEPESVAEPGKPPEPEPPAEPPPEEPSEGMTLLSKAEQAKARGEHRLAAQIFAQAAGVLENEGNPEAAAQSRTHAKGERAAAGITEPEPEPTPVEKALTKAQVAAIRYRELMEEKKGPSDAEIKHGKNMGKIASEQYQKAIEALEAELAAKEDPEKRKQLDALKKKKETFDAKRIPTDEEVAAGAELPSEEPTIPGVLEEVDEVHEKAGEAIEEGLDEAEKAAAATREALAGEEAAEEAPPEEEPQTFVLEAPPIVSEVPSDDKPFDIGDGVEVYVDDEGNFKVVDTGIDDKIGVDEEGKPVIDGTWTTTPLNEKQAETLALLQRDVAKLQAKPAAPPPKPFDEEFFEEEDTGPEGPSADELMTQAARAQQTAEGLLHEPEEQQKALSSALEDARRAKAMFEKEKRDTSGVDDFISRTENTANTLEEVKGDMARIEQLEAEAVAAKSHRERAAKYREIEDVSKALVDKLDAKIKEGNVDPSVLGLHRGKYQGEMEHASEFARAEEYQADRAKEPPLEPVAAAPAQPPVPEPEPAPPAEPAAPTEPEPEPAPIFDEFGLPALPSDATIAQRADRRTQLMAKANRVSSDPELKRDLLLEAQAEAERIARQPPTSRRDRSYKWHAQNDMLGIELEIEKAEELIAAKEKVRKKEEADAAVAGATRYRQQIEEQQRIVGSAEEQHLDCLVACGDEENNLKRETSLAMGKQNELIGKLLDTYEETGDERLLNRAIELAGVAHLDAKDGHVRAAEALEECTFCGDEEAVEQQRSRLLENAEANLAKTSNALGDDVLAKAEEAEDDEERRRLLKAAKQAYENAANEGGTELAQRLGVSAKTKKVDAQLAALPPEKTVNELVTEVNAQTNAASVERNQGRRDAILRVGAEKSEALARRLEAEGNAERARALREQAQLLRNSIGKTQEQVKLSLGVVEEEPDEEPAAPAQPPPEPEPVAEPAAQPEPAAPPPTKPAGPVPEGPLEGPMVVPGRVSGDLERDAKFTVDVGSEGGSVEVGSVFEVVRDGKVVAAGTVREIDSEGRPVVQVHRLSPWAARVKEGDEIQILPKGVGPGGMDGEATRGHTPYQARVKEQQRADKIGDASRAADEADKQLNQMKDKFNTDVEDCFSFWGDCNVHDTNLERDAASIGEEQQEIIDELLRVAEETDSDALREKARRLAEEWDKDAGEKYDEAEDRGCIDCSTEDEIKKLRAGISGASGNLKEDLGKPPKPEPKPVVLGEGEVMLGDIVEADKSMGFPVKDREARVSAYEQCVALGKGECVRVTARTPSGRGRSYFMPKDQAEAAQAKAKARAEAPPPEPEKPPTPEPEPAAPPEEHPEPAAPTKPPSEAEAEQQARVQASLTEATERATKVKTDKAKFSEDATDCFGIFGDDCDDEDLNLKGRSQQIATEQNKIIQDLLDAAAENNNDPALLAEAEKLAREFAQDAQESSNKAYGRTGDCTYCDDEKFVDNQEFGIFSKTQTALGDVKSKQADIEEEAARKIQDPKEREKRLREIEGLRREVSGHYNDASSSNAPDMYDKQRSTNAAIADALVEQAKAENDIEEKKKLLKKAGRMYRDLQKWATRKPEENPKLKEAELEASRAGIPDNHFLRADVSRKSTLEECKKLNKGKCSSFGSGDNTYFAPDAEVNAAVKKANAAKRKYGVIPSEGWGTPPAAPAPPAVAVPTTHDDLFGEYETKRDAARTARDEGNLELALTGYDETMTQLQTVIDSGTATPKQVRNYKARMRKLKNEKAKVEKAKQKAEAKVARQSEAERQRADEERRRAEAEAARQADEERRRAEAEAARAAEPKGDRKLPQLTADPPPTELNVQGEVFQVYANQPFDLGGKEAVYVAYSPDSKTQIYLDKKGNPVGYGKLEPDGRTYTIKPGKGGSRSKRAAVAKAFKRDFAVALGKPPEPAPVAAPSPPAAVPAAPAPPQPAPAVVATSDDPDSLKEDADIQAKRGPDETHEDYVASLDNAVENYKKAAKGYEDRGGRGNLRKAKAMLRKAKVAEKKAAKLRKKVVKNKADAAAKDKTSDGYEAAAKVYEKAAKTAPTQELKEEYEAQAAKFKSKIPEGHVNEAKAAAKAAKAKDKEAAKLQKKIDKEKRKGKKADAAKIAELEGERDAALREAEEQRDVVLNSYNEATTAYEEAGEEAKERKYAKEIAKINEAAGKKAQASADALARQASSIKRKIESLRGKKGKEAELAALEEQQMQVLEARQNALDDVVENYNRAGAIYEEEEDEKKSKAAKAKAKKAKQTSDKEILAPARAAEAVAKEYYDQARTLEEEAFDSKALSEAEGKEYNALLEKLKKARAKRAELEAEGKKPKEINRELNKIFPKKDQDRFNALYRRAFPKELEQAAEELFRKERQKYLDAAAAYDKAANRASTPELKKKYEAAAAALRRKAQAVVDWELSRLEITDPDLWERQMMEELVDDTIPAGLQRVISESGQKGKRTATEEEQREYDRLMEQVEKEAARRRKAHQKMLGQQYRAELRAGRPTPGESLVADETHDPLRRSLEQAEEDGTLDAVREHHKAEITDITTAADEHVQEADKLKAEIEKLKAETKDKPIDSSDRDTIAKLKRIKVLEDEESKRRARAAYQYETVGDGAKAEQQRLAAEQLTRPEQEQGVLIGSLESPSVAIAGKDVKTQFGDEFKFDKDKGTIKQGKVNAKRANYRQVTEALGARPATVVIERADGSTTTGYLFEDGNYYDKNGRYVPLKTGDTLHVDEYKAQDDIAKAFNEPDPRQEQSGMSRAIEEMRKNNEQAGRLERLKGSLERDIGQLKSEDEREELQGRLGGVREALGDNTEQRRALITELSELKAELRTEDDEEDKKELEQRIKAIEGPRGSLERLDADKARLEGEERSLAYDIRQAGTEEERIRLEDELQQVKQRLEQAQAAAAEAKEKLEKGDFGDVEEGDAADWFEKVRIASAGKKGDKAAVKAAKGVREKRIKTQQHKELCGAYQQAIGTMGPGCKKDEFPDAKPLEDESDKKRAAKSGYCTEAYKHGDKVICKGKDGQHYEVTESGKLKNGRGETVHTRYKNERGATCSRGKADCKAQHIVKDANGQVAGFKDSEGKDLVPPSHLQGKGFKDVVKRKDKVTGTIKGGTATEGWEACFNNKLIFIPSQVGACQGQEQQCVMNRDGSCTLYDDKGDWDEEVVGQIKQVGGTNVLFSNGDCRVGGVRGREGVVLDSNNAEIASGCITNDGKILGEGKQINAQGCVTGGGETVCADGSTIEKDDGMVITTQPNGMRKICLAADPSKCFDSGYRTEPTDEDPHGRPCDPNAPLEEDRDPTCRLRLVNQDGEALPDFENEACKEPERHGMNKAECEKLFDRGKTDTTWTPYWQTADQASRDLAFVCGIWESSELCDNEWTRMMNEFFANHWLGKFLIGNWEDSVCSSSWGMDIGTFGGGLSTLPDQESIDCNGIPCVWATANKQEVQKYTDERSGAVENKWLYRINFEVGPSSICNAPKFIPEDDEASDEDIQKAKDEFYKDAFVYFKVYVKKSGTTKVLDIDLKQNPDGSYEPDEIKLRCDTGPFQAFGPATLIRYSSTNFQEICIKLLKEDEEMEIHFPDGETEDYARYNSIIDQSGTEICNDITNDGPTITDLEVEEAEDAPEDTERDPAGLGENRPQISNPGDDEASLEI